MDLLIILGSDSDLPVVQKGLDLLENFSVDYEIKIASAHRTPEFLDEIIGADNFEVVIAAAGGAAHLPGVIAAKTIKPVIGLPINSNLNGQDSLYSIVQMPGGIPVATVGIDNAKNAVLLAVEILALQNEKLSKELFEFRESQAKNVLSKNQKIAEQIKKSKKN